MSKHKGVALVAAAFLFLGACSSGAGEDSSTDAPVADAGTSGNAGDQGETGETGETGNASVLEECSTEHRTLLTAVEAYAAMNDGTFPTSFDDLTDLLRRPPTYWELAPVSGSDIPEIVLSAEGEAAGCTVP